MPPTLATAREPGFALAAFGAGGWAVVIGYFALMVAVGYFAGRRRGEATTGDFFLAGRSLPAWALAASIVATTLSAATFVGVPDEVYLGDIGYLVLFLGGFLAVFIVAFLFVPKLYRAGTVTVYGYLGPRFGEGAVIAVSSAFLVGRLLASGARLFFAAIPLCLLLFGTSDASLHRGQLVIAIVLVGSVGTFYTVTGGIRAVVWTDSIQLVLVIGAALLTIGVLLHRIPLSIGEIYSLLNDPASGPGGRAKLHLIDTSWDLSKKYTLWAGLFGVVFLNVANYGVDQDFAQRFLVSKSPLRGGLSVIVGQLITVAVVCLFMTVGLLLWVFYKRPAEMGAAWPGYAPAGKLEAAYPLFLLKELPPALSGLAIAGFFAVAQGSLDSAINAMAGSALVDIYYPLRRRLGRADDPNRPTAAPRIAVALMGALLCLFAIGCALIYDPHGSSLLDFAYGVMNYAFAGMLGVFLTALFTRRGNSMSVIAALLAGAAAVALVQTLPLAWPWWTPVGAAVSFGVCAAGGSKGEAIPVESSPRRTQTARR